MQHTDVCQNPFSDSTDHPGPKSPQLLYKYAPPCLAKHILANRTLRLTPPDQLNDPLDCAPSFQTPKDDELLETQWKRMMRLDYESSPLKGEISLEDFSARREPDKASAFAAWRRPIEEGDLDWGQRLRDGWSREMGVLCLSERCDSMLMWSHYADSHRGFVVGFDPQAAFLNTFPDGGALGCFGHPRRVRYSEDRPTSLPPGFANPKSENAALVATLLTKCVDWQYESEWRLILPLSMGNKSLSSDIVTLAFPPSAVRSIILGFRMPIDLRKRIVSLFSHTYKNAQLLDAKPSVSSFKMVVGQFSVC